MFVIDKREASAGLRDNDEANLVVSWLKQSGYTPMLRTILDCAYSCAGLTRPAAELDAIRSERYSSRRYQGGPGPLGDVFFSETHVFVFEPSFARIAVSAIRHHSEEPKIEEFCEVLARGARGRLDGRRLRGMSFEWRHSEPVSQPQSRRFRRRPNDESLTSHPAEYSQEEASQADLFVDPETKDLIMRLAQLRGKARISDTRTDSVDVSSQTLIENGLLRKEYLILCRQDSHTICSLGNRDQLEAEIGADLKCSLCGRPFKNENIQEILVLAESATRLLEGSHWMTIWVTEQLRKAGIPQSKISWNAAAGEDEIDIIADVQGSKVFFELKDRDFGLGDAYPFVFRVERYGADVGVVISADHIAPEVTDFFKERPAERAAVPLHTMQGLDQARQHLPELVDEVSRGLALGVLDAFSDSVGSSITPVLKSWMNKVASVG